MHHPASIGRRHLTHCHMSLLCQCTESLLLWMFLLNLLRCNGLRKFIEDHLLDILAGPAWTLLTLEDQICKFTTQQLQKSAQRWWFKDMNKQLLKKTNTSYFPAAIMRRHISNRKLKESRLFLRATPKEIGKISLPQQQKRNAKLAAGGDAQAYTFCVLRAATPACRCMAWTEDNFNGSVPILLF